MGSPRRSAHPPSSSGHAGRDVGTLHGMRSFTSAGARYRYHAAAYNATWRTSEPSSWRFPYGSCPIPAAASWKSAMFCATTLPSLMTLEHEQADLSRNIDALDVRVTQPYDVIVSISTLEHRAGGGRQGPRQARAGSGAPGVDAGAQWDLIATVQPGYNPALNAALLSGSLRFDRLDFLKRISRDNRWREATAATCGGTA